MSTTTRKKRIDALFLTLDEDYCSEKQLRLIDSFRDQFVARGDLSDRQIDIFEDINRRASERDRPLRGCG